MSTKVEQMVALSSDGKLATYGWPGGYPLLYTDGNNEILCPTCAQEKLDDPDEWEDWKPQDWFIHYEGSSFFCSGCNREVESAYGDPDQEGS
jgi:hypothetical protein